MPYWRLSAFYFFYFAVLGVLAPYWGLYLKSLGFGAQQIGVLMAIPLATKIVAPNVWGWLADVLPSGRSLVPTAAALSLAAFLGLFAAVEFLWIAAAMAGFSFFWNATLPSMEATTLNFLGERWDRYGVIRLWGSVGFIVLVSSMGWIVDVRGPAAVLPAISIMLAGMWIAVAVIRPGVAPAKPAAVAEPAGHPLRQGHVLGLLLACLLMQASHAPFYAFFTLYLEHHGYSKSLIGGLWALGVAAEIVIFLFMQKLFRRFTILVLLQFSFVVTVLRWLLVTALPEQLSVVVFTQLLHAVTFGVYHASAIQLIHKFFPARHQHRGQALYSSMSFGVGGALGSLYSGWLWEHAGPASIYLTAAAAAAGAALVTNLLVARALKDPS